MDELDPALRVAMAAVEQLPQPLQRQLAEAVIVRTTGAGQLAVACLERLPSNKQSRLDLLLDRQSENRLNTAQRRELQQLGAEADRIMLANAESLARAMHPEVFDSRGKLIRRRAHEALAASRPARRTQRVRGASRR